MRPPPSTGCDVYQDKLLALLCEELASSDATEVRAHADHCPMCGPALRNLEGLTNVKGDMPLLTPSKEFDERIMQAARVAASGRARLVAPMEAPAAATGPSLRDILARLATWAMSPQVAMASVLLLMVGIGLYAIPLRKEGETVALKTAAEHELGPEPVEEPMPGRALSDEADEPPAAQTGAATAFPLSEDQAAARVRGSVSAPNDGAEKRSEKPAIASKERARASSAGGGRAGLGSLSAPAKSRASTGASKGTAPSAWPKAESKKSAAAMQEFESAASLDDVQAAEKAAPRKSESAPAAAPPAPASVAKTDSADDAALREGTLAAQSGDYARAATLLEPLLKSGSAAVRAGAVRWLAFSLRGKGDCSEAVKYYRQLIMPVSVPRAVLEEAADCHERLGHPELAGRLRARAGN